MYSVLFSDLMEPALQADSISKQSSTTLPLWLWTRGHRLHVPLQLLH